MDQANADRIHITNRWLEYEGELRAGLLRVGLIICFYAVELITYLTAENVDKAMQQFHRQTTYLSAAWLLVSLAALVVIARRSLPAGLKYASSGADIVLLTAVAWYGSGAASPLVCLYLLLVIMAGLRGSLKLIWFTTSLALACYAALVVWAPEISRAVKPISVMVVLLGIAATGIVTGQVVRMLRQVVSEVYQRTAPLPVDQALAVQADDTGTSATEVRT